MPPIEGMVFLAFMWTDDDRERVADRLFEDGRRSYEESIRQQLRAFGCDDKGVYLRAEQELSWLRQQADVWSGSIVATYNRDLRAEAGRIVSQWQQERGTLFGLNRNVLSSRLRDWHVERDSWKQKQIAVTEQTRSWDRATLTFADMNIISGDARVVPEKAVCDVCQEYVAMGWMPLREAERLLFLPAHVACPHLLELRADETVDCEDMWRGESFSQMKAAEKVGVAGRSGWFAPPRGTHGKGSQGGDKGKGGGASGDWVKDGLAQAGPPENSWEATVLRQGMLTVEYYGSEGGTFSQYREINLSELVRSVEAPDDSVGTNVKIRDNSGSIELTIRYERDGEYLGSAERKVTRLPNDNLKVYNGNLELEDKGTGLGGQLYRRQITTLAADSRYERIELVAGGSVGKYAWARQGFEFSDPERLGTAVTLFGEWLGRRGHTTPDLGSIASAASLASFSIPGVTFYGKDITNKAVPRDLAMDAGKAFMLDAAGCGAWEGYFDLQRVRGR